MAKKSMVARDVQRVAMVARFAEKRNALKKIIFSKTTSDDERFEAVIKLQKMPRNASPSRVRNRCRITGRPRGYYRKFGLSRNRLREVMNRGEVPGAVKASW